MAAILAGNNVEEEYMWSCTLDKTTKEFQWSPEDPSDAKDDDDKEDPTLKPGHRLLIKNAILMPEAKKDEVTVLQIECDGYNKKKVTAPIVAMKGGVDHQRYIDLLVPCPAKITLLQGEGPIHLIGSHCVDFYGYRDHGPGSDAESEEEDEVDMEAEEQEATAEGDKKEESKKRKASGDATPEKGKKTKTEEAPKSAEKTGSAKKDEKVASAEKKEKRKSK